MMTAFLNDTRLNNYQSLQQGQSHSESLLDDLNSDSLWLDYLQRKECNTSEYRITSYRELMSDSECRRMLSDISRGEYTFSIPKKRLISKFKVGKKRVVYSFNEREMMALRLISYQLYAYDYLFSPNLYSFRRNIGVRNAIDVLRNNSDLQTMYGYKADIHNYFNSINVEDLLRRLKIDLNDDRLYELFDGILSDRRVNYNGEIIEEDKGVMAGIPISAFLANYYLRDVDNHFFKEDCVYMRYADDIILFSKDESELSRLRMELINMIESKGLEMNPKKELYFRPGDKFEFLGFSIQGNEIDLSEATVRKMKGKISRSSRSIRRWMVKKDAPLEGTLRALIRTYNSKFFGYDEMELTWGRWFFPVITTSKSLHEIDLYFQEWIRYVSSGKHSKKNFVNVPYELMKECGYRSLVSEYYKSLEEGSGEVKNNSS